MGAILPVMPEKYSLRVGEVCHSKVNGHSASSYSVVGMLGNEGMFLLRDPLEFKPLVLGKNNSYCISSETIALNFLSM